MDGFNDNQKPGGKVFSPVKGGESAHGAPSLNLPKGGGAIRGIGEKFAANPVTGTGSMTVPIATSPGRSGFGPDLSLSYDSGAGNGPFGLGWNLSLPSITRKTDKGLPRYRDADESDVFILSGAEDLVPVLRKQGNDWVPEEVPDRTIGADTYRIKRYRPRIEGLFARIERWTNTRTNETHWYSLSRDNILTVYGRTTNSRIEDPNAPEDAPRVFSWLICESYDDKGHAIYYKYEPENSADLDPSRVNERNRTDNDRSANRYLKRIKYGNKAPFDLDSDLPREFREDLSARKDWLFEVVFDYEEGHYKKLQSDSDTHLLVQAQKDPTQDWQRRQDPFSSYRSGFEVRTYRLCRRVLMFHHFPDELGADDCLVRSTEFEYRESPVASFITRVTHSGYKRRGDGTYRKKSLPPLEFKYSEATIQDRVEDVDEESIENLPQGLDGSQYRWVDIDGEGLSGILAEQGDSWFYKQNISPLPVRDEDDNPRVAARFAPMERLAEMPSLADLSGGRQQLLDLAGDGQLDVVELDGPTPGFYERTREESWHTFRPFESLPNLSWQDPNLKFVDLTGDGHADILITEDQAFTWYASLAEAGFGPAKRVIQALDEEKGPKLLFADGTQSIYLADLSGDGLTDLVRIRNGEVCYWPNLGYGRFGAKVTMDNAPRFDSPDRFDQHRIRLADIDGSGVTDIIYLKEDGVYIYLNESGNRWTDAKKLNSFPKIDNLSSVMAVDLLGNDTACLVWSSPLPGHARKPMRYIDLMGGQKPHLLTRMVNNLGAETHIHYAPSTRFYLTDKKAGKPWITKIPFPVHVVERVETFDHISRNRFVTRYAYHHGYFDGVEREFRGFGMVEQWDTEKYATLSKSRDFPIGDNIDESSHVPPVYTRTWFHTGFFPERSKISRQYEEEYYKGDPDAWLLPDTILPDGLTAGEEREACRALKGSMLRREVHAEDGTDKAEHPYTVTEQNFTIRKLQPRGENRHAVFFTHPREAITCHYERNPADPRIQHSLTLEVDDYGNVLKQVDIGYGRRPGRSPLTGDDKEKQENLLIAYTENNVTNAIDTDNDHRTPLPCETRTYELTGLTPDNAAQRFSYDELTKDNYEKTRTLQPVPYEEPVDYSVKRKRLIEHIRTLYRPNDLGASCNDPMALLPLGTVESLALPGETYRLAFTPGLLSDVFKRNDQPLLPADPAAVLGSVADDEGGYMDLDGDGHWWIPSGRVFYSPGTNDTPVQELAEARSHFFLQRRFRDPFGQETTVTYDAYDLLVYETRDPLGNRVTAGEREYRLPDGTVLPVKRCIDYRVLQPSLMMDPNRNRTKVAFDTLGLVVGTAVMGKPEEQKGDLIDNTFKADLSDEEIDHFYNLDDPHTVARQHLAKATTRIIYDVDRFMRTRKSNPANPERWEAPFAATLAREIHYHDNGGNQTPIQLSFSYSDGFGREIQKKIQAEKGKVPRRDAEGRIVFGADNQPEMTDKEREPRWVGSGWTVFNNKGKPVRQYEPFFTDTHRFEFEPKIGVSPVLFYDPLERVVATLHPNHTWEKVVFEPWRQETWDVNDTVRIDPSQDEDTKGFFLKPDDSPRLPEEEYLPTWHALRTDPAHSLEFERQYPDATDRERQKKAAEKTEAHGDTPAITHFDSLGRPFLAIANNGRDQNGNAILYETRTILDIEGNQREVVDAKGRVVMRYRYHMAGPEEDEEGNRKDTHRIHQASMEAGERWMLTDVTGNPIRSWDSRGHEFRTAYDRLRRPIEQYVTGEDSDLPDSRLRNKTVLFEKTEYGESLPEQQAIALNLRTRVFKQYDGAGIVTSVAKNPITNRDEAYDFKGNLLRSSRQLCTTYVEIPNWDANPELEKEQYVSSTRYDALNRPIQQVRPYDVTATPVKLDVTQITYNKANLLEKVHVWLARSAEPDGMLDAATADHTAIKNINYDAKGQRELIEYGNGAETRYRYDKKTFRLVHLYTRRGTTFTGDCGVDPNLHSSPEKPPPDTPCGIQNLHYTYDPAGNITHIRDLAQTRVYFNNQRIDASNDYRYDAIYRLIAATGREHKGADSAPSTFDRSREGDMIPSDGTAIRNYVEVYEYDEVGNFKSITHHVGNNLDSPGDVVWKRIYEHDEESQLESSDTSNRLTRTTVDSRTQTYSENSNGYDAHGNMLRMPHLSVMAWDYKDQLYKTSTQVVNNGTPETTYYVYDGSGQRVRKITVRQDGEKKEERIYLGGFEIYRKFNGNGQRITLQRESLHIMDNRQRVALIETKTLHETGVTDGGNNDDLGVPLVRYQINNHLGSTCTELDDQANIISYEEYHPYGTTAYHAKNKSIKAAAKRYRYSGKEQDEENGFYYYGARYYAAWLGRWVSCDPAGIVDGLNIYSFVRINPIKNYDPQGTSSQDNYEDINIDFRAGEEAPYRILQGGGFYFYGSGETPLLKEWQYEQLQQERTREQWLLDTEKKIIEWSEEDRIDMILSDPALIMTQDEWEKWSARVLKQDQEGRYFFDLTELSNPDNIDLWLVPVSDIRQGFGFIIAAEGSAHYGPIGGHGRVGKGWLYVPGGNPEGYSFTVGRAAISAGAGAKGIVYINFITRPVDLMNLEPSINLRLSAKGSGGASLIWKKGPGGGIDVSIQALFGARIRIAHSSRGLSLEIGPTIGVGGGATRVTAGADILQVSPSKEFSDYPMYDPWMASQRPGLVY